MGEESLYNNIQQGPIASIDGGKGVDLSKSDLAGFLPKGTIDTAGQDAANVAAYNQSAYTPPVYGNDTLYPGMREGIGVGNFSSQTTGSQTIYAPTGQYMPYDILQKREKALSDAAAIRQQRLAALKMPTGPSTKNPFYQKQVNDLSMGVIDKYKNEAQRLHGKDWNTALLDPNANTEIGKRFRLEMGDLDVLTRKTDMVTDMAAAVVADKEGLYAPETRAKMNDINYAIKDLQAGTLTPGELTKAVEQARAYKDLDEYINKNYGNLKADVTEWEREYETANGEKTRTEAGKRSYIEAKADAIAEALKSETGHYGDADFVTKEDIKKRIMARVPLENKNVTKEVTSAQALKRIGAGDGSDEDASNRLNKLNIITNPLEGINLEGVKLSDGTSYKRSETQLTDELNKSKAAAALGVLIGSDYQGGKVKTAEYRVKNVNGTMVPYVYMELTKFKQDEDGNVVQDSEPGKILIDLNDTKSMSELNTVFNGSKSEKKINQDQLEKVKGSVKQEVKPVLGETNAKDELLTREELKAKGEGYVAKRKAEGVTVKVDESKKKTISKKPTAPKKGDKKTLKSGKIATFDGTQWTL